MKIIYTELISITILISLFSVSIPKYTNSNLKKFLSHLGVPDIPEGFQNSEGQILNNNETEPSIEEEFSEEIQENEDIQDDEMEDAEDKDEDEDEKEEEPKDDEKEDEKEGEKESEKQDDDEKKEEKEKTYINIKCLWVEKYNVYSLQELLNDKEDYIKEFQHGKVIFNFCRNTHNNSESTVIWENNKTNEVIQVAGSIDGDSNNKNEWDELNDDDDPGLIIKLTHPKEKQCNGKYHQTYLKIYCDPEIDDKDFLNSVNLSEFYDKNYPCKHYITGRSIYGCALNSWYLLRRLVNQYKYFFSAGLVLIGGFLLMFGNKCKTPTIIILMGIIFCFILSIIALNFLSSFIKTEKHLFYLLGGSFLVGGFIGFLLRAKITIFTVLLGISMGYSMAEIVYQFVQGFISWNPKYLYYSTIGVCCLLGIVVGFILIKSIFVIGTSLLGGYIAMRGVSVIFGNYLDEGQFADLIKNGEYEQLKDLQSGWAYAYLGLWVVLTIFGIYYQCIGFKKESTSESNDYKPIKKSSE